MAPHEGVTSDTDAHEAGHVERVSTWNIANVLTMARIALVPFFGWALLADGGDSTALRLTAWALFFVACVTDRIDGDLARKRGLETEFGKLMDPIADKLLMGTAFIGLSLIGLLPWWATALMLARELAVTGLRFVVIRQRGGVIPASRGGKIKTALQAFGAGLFVFPLPHWAHMLAWFVMAAAIVVTVVTGVEYFLNARRAGRESGRS